MFGAKVETPTRAVSQSSGDKPLFGSPEEYEHLTEDERKKLTQKMLRDHKSKRFVGVSVNGG